jgi:hypothetical protein
MEIGNQDGGGAIFTERRSPILDQELELAWLDLKIKGTRFMRGGQIESRISALHLCCKKSNLAGLQLADLVVTPIGRKVLGKAVKEDYRIVEGKFRRSPEGKTDGFGLVVLPRQCQAKEKANPRYAVISP